MGEKPHATIQKRLPTPAEKSAMGRKGFSPLFARNENEIMDIKIFWNETNRYGTK